MQVFEGLLSLETIPVKVARQGTCECSTQDTLNGIVLRFAADNTEICHLEMHTENQANTFCKQLHCIYARHWALRPFMSEEALEAFVRRNSHCQQHYQASLLQYSYMCVQFFSTSQNYFLQSKTIF